MEVKSMRERVSESERNLALKHPIISGVGIAITGYGVARAAEKPLKKVGGFVKGTFGSLFKGGDTTEEAMALGAGSVWSFIRSVTKR